MKNTYLLLVFITLASFGCTQDAGPGYQFELFKNTTSWELAKAVEKEDEEKMLEILGDKKININFQERQFGNTILHLAVGNDKLKSTEILLKYKADINLRDINERAAIHEV